MEKKFDEAKFQAAAVEIQTKVAKFPDFPKPGVLFYDLFSLLYDQHLRKLVIDCMLYLTEKHFAGKFDVICGLEARGMMLGFYLAEVLKVPFIPFRKPGKLPGEVVKVSFQKEYGGDAFEVQKSALKKGTRALFVDDLLATGGSFAACDQLADLCEATVAGYLIIFNLGPLHGERKLKHPELVRYILNVDY